MSFQQSRSGNLVQSTYGLSSCMAVVAAAADAMADELIMTLSWPLTCPVEWV